MRQTRWRRARPIALALACVVAIGFIADHPAAAQERSSPAPPGSFTLRWTPDPAHADKAAVEVSGFSATALKELEQVRWTPAQWERLLSVYAGQGDLAMDIGLPAMLGSYRVASGMLRFEPQFPLEPGVNYRAMFHPGWLPGETGTEGIISARFELPARRPRPTTMVQTVYPSAEVVPENLLKFYVHFSAPMSRGHIYDHIHLRDDAGKEIELPFLEIDEELWDPAMTRLTLFIDPGRIKRGVLPLEEVGPALEAGKRYTLLIDPSWKDATGQPLREIFRKAFSVASPDRDPPDPKHWRIQAPKADAHEPLLITFPEPLDHALAQRLIRVVGESGEMLEGKTALENEERRWSFTPARPWPRGAYQVVIQTTIEDLAGNNIGKPFEVDVIERIEPRLTSQSVKLPFEVR